MKQNCPNCLPQDQVSGGRSKIVRAGRFRRSSDGRVVQRFKCTGCRKHFSNATFHPCYRQNKRQMNERLKRMLCSGVSQRRAAKLLNLSRTTVKNKFLFLGEIALKELGQTNEEHPPAQIVEFDDLETFEHTKYKPLSVTLMVESGTRRILGFEVAKMPAKGLLAKRAIKKYGVRSDERGKKRHELFSRMKTLVARDALIKSDQNPYYPKDVKRFFPDATHQSHKGQRGSIVGQGELKKVRFDPLFSLNHSCAMLRANINRLFRRTWCTTKLSERLKLHIAMYAVFHNKVLLESS